MGSCDLAFQAKNILGKYFLAVFISHFIIWLWCLVMSVCVYVYLFFHAHKITHKQIEVLAVQICSDIPCSGIDFELKKLRPILCGTLNTRTGHGLSVMTLAICGKFWTVNYIFRPYIFKIKR